MMYSNINSFYAALHTSIGRTTGAARPPACVFVRARNS